MHVFEIAILFSANSYDNKVDNCLNFAIKTLF